MASGNTLVSFGATDNHPPASAYATPDVRNSHPLLNFDAASAEDACFHGVIPAHYGGGGLTIIVIWMAATATSGNAMWKAAMERLEAGGTDLDADSFATAQAAAAAAANATSGALTYTTVTMTSGAQMDSLAVGEAFRLKVTRDAANASDTMTGDAQLIAVHVKET